MLLKHLLSKVIKDLQYAQLNPKKLDKDKVKSTLFKMFFRWIHWFRQWWGWQLSDGDHVRVSSETCSSFGGRKWGINVFLNDLQNHDMLKENTKFLVFQFILGLIACYSWGIMNHTCISESILKSLYTNEGLDETQSEPTVIQIRLCNCQD